jgi:pilus assembly protein CpaF
MEAHTSVLADRVRDLVRQRRVDPRTDVASVRLAALDAIAEHEARSLTGAVGTLDEPEVMVGQIVAEVSGFGPLQALLDDPTVEEVST